MHYSAAHWTTRACRYINDYNARADPANAATGERRLARKDSNPPARHKSRDAPAAADVFTPDGPMCLLMRSVTVRAQSTRRPKPVAGVVWQAHAPCRSLDWLQVRHKWIQPVTCKATFRTGAIGSYGFGVISFHVDAARMAKHHLMVADKGGKVRWVKGRCDSNSWPLALESRKQAPQQVVATLR